MAFSFGFKKRNKNTNKNDAQNTNSINITTGVDVLYNIGENLGEIKTAVKMNNTNLEKINRKIHQHDKRLGALEKRVDKLDGAAK